MRRLLALLLASLLCASAFAQIELRDDLGRTHEFAAPPARIVSLLPSLTESVCVLGACARLVGTDRFSNWPTEARALPRVGGLEDAQVERIVALRPDVVLAGTSARVIDRLESLGLAVVVLRSETYADVQRTLGTLAQLLGTPERSAPLWQRIESELNAAAGRVPPALRGKRVYFEIAAGPYAAGAGSFIGETLERLGLANVVPPELGPFPKLSGEYVVRAQPDVVMAARRELRGMPARPGWGSLRALDGRVCGFDNGQFDMLTRPGPRMGEAAKVLADCLAGLRTTP